MGIFQVCSPSSPPQTQAEYQILVFQCMLGNHWQGAHWMPVQQTQLLGSQIPCALQYMQQLHWSHLPP
ncbi:hypothetical protein E4T56_gene14705 [Termitomyces sp. T112]|nr:hypothetical protein E4T56_gene14705 [Termitomyces sp. T112]